MLDESSWLPLAKELQRGQKQRVNHTCKADRSMIINAGDNGWSAYCFRCGSGFHPYPTPSLAERLERLAVQREADDHAKSSVVLPSPALHDVTQWPSDASVWLYKAGFPIPEINKHGWYWSERLHRVILPVKQNNVPVFWQGRNVHDDYRPKYLAPEADRSRIAAEYDSSIGMLVLTEDILSAAKVSRQFNAWSILGTKLPEPLMHRLVLGRRPVVVWLDPDKAGMDGMNKIVNTLRSFNVQCTGLVSRADPKLLCNQEISDAIKEVTV